MNKYNIMYIHYNPSAYWKWLNNDKHQLCLELTEKTKTQRIIQLNHNTAELSI